MYEMLHYVQQIEEKNWNAKMLYTGSMSVLKEKGISMKGYFVSPGHGNDIVAPDKYDLELYKKEIITEKGFILNYEMKLRSQEAYKWMQRVAEDASHNDVVLVGEELGSEKIYRTILAEMVASMFGGKMSFRYLGELK